MPSGVYHCLRAGGSTKQGCSSSFRWPGGAGRLGTGDPVAGAKTFKVCFACHIATGAKNKVGPTLQGVVARPVASIADFKYSKAMTEFGQGKVWDEAQLTEYLKAPKTVVKGTKMAFAGLKKDEDIANVITYLKDPAVGGH